jgi:transposase
VIIEVYRVCSPECGVKVEKVPQLPSKAPFSKRFEEAVGLACESASVRQVARQFGLAASTVRAIDLRYLRRWNATRRKDPLKEMGVDEIYFGKQMKFITVVSNLDTGEPLWFGQDRKQETLDEFFPDATQRRATKTSGGGVRGYVATVYEQHRTVGPELPDCVRQISRSTARQQRH